MAFCYDVNKLIQYILQLFYVYTFQQNKRTLITTFDWNTLVESSGSKRRRNSQKRRIRIRKSDYILFIALFLRFLWLYGGKKA